MFYFSGLLEASIGGCSMILLSPYSQKMRNGERNPKDYPHWHSVISQLNKLGYSIIQIGVTGETPITGVANIRFNLPLDELKKLVQECQTWMSVDNFFPHLCYTVGKLGVTVWGRSDPNIFGYTVNTNLLKSRQYLREKQYDIWEAITYDANVFVTPEDVVAAVQERVR
jgi:ADP-heptose:LPS heptosyltransferase